MVPKSTLGQALGQDDTPFVLTPGRNSLGIGIGHGQHADLGPLIFLSEVPPDPRQERLDPALARIEFGKHFLDFVGDLGPLGHYRDQAEGAEQCLALKLGVGVAARRVLQEQPGPDIQGRIGMLGVGILAQELERLLIESRGDRVEVLAINGGESRVGFAGQVGVIVTRRAFQ